jgi:hypothetical protein
MFNEVVMESMIAGMPMTVISTQQELTPATDTQDGTGLTDDWVYVPAHSTLGLELGLEKGSVRLDSPPSPVSHTGGTPRITIKAIIPLQPVALFPATQEEEVGITVKFVPPTGMTSLRVEDLLPSDRALRAAADAKLAAEIDSLYARHDHGFMAETVFAGGYGNRCGGDGYPLKEWDWMEKEGGSGHERGAEVPLGRLGAGVQSTGRTSGSQAESTGPQVSVRITMAGVTETTPPKGDGDDRIGAEQCKGDIEGEHKASGGVLAKVVELTKGWIWRSG